MDGKGTKMSHYSHFPQEEQSPHLPTSATFENPSLISSLMIWIMAVVKRRGKVGGGLCLFAGWHLSLASLSLPLAGITEEEGGGRMTNKCCHISPLPSSHQLSRNGFPPPPPSKSLNFLFPGEGIAWSRSRNRTLFVVDSLDRERLISLPFLPHVSSKLNSWKSNA